MVYIFSSHHSFQLWNCIFFAFLTSRSPDASRPLLSSAVNLYKTINNIIYSHSVMLWCAVCLLIVPVTLKTDRKYSHLCLRGKICSVCWGSSMQKMQFITCLFAEIIVTEKIYKQNKFDLKKTTKFNYFCCYTSSTWVVI